MDIDRDRHLMLQRMLDEFMQREVLPVEFLYAEQVQQGCRDRTPPIVQELKRKARELGLWNLFLPGEHGAGLTILQYAPLAESMGRVFGPPKCSIVRRRTPATWKC
jgi:acyl-CoA dehydrogenase